MTRIDETWRPVVVGEVLFDVFPDGRRVLGGAPFNVAWNLQALGLRPVLITRVGDDDDGGAVMAAVAAWGMETAGVQRDESRPTGHVQVGGAAGEPTFEIVADQAYDALDTEVALNTISRLNVSLVYHGSLVLRSERSGHALRKVRAQTDAPVFVDVNLRNPWWKGSEVLDIVRGSTWVKLNEAELAGLSDRPLEDVEAAPEAAAERFRTRFGPSVVIVTRGPEGAVFVDVHGAVSGRAPESFEVIDTVGAGDAFSSVVIIGLTSGWAGELILDRALEFASAICSIRGATTDDRDFYSGWRGRWENAGRS